MKRVWNEFKNLFAGVLVLAVFMITAVGTLGLLMWVGELYARTH